MPHLAGVDLGSWMLSQEAIARCVFDWTTAINTVGWLGTICDLYQKNTYLGLWALDRLPRDLKAHAEVAGMGWIVRFSVIR